MISNILRRVLQKRKAPAGVVQLLGQFNSLVNCHRRHNHRPAAIFRGDCLSDGTRYSRFYGRVCAAGYYEEFRLRGDPAAATAISCGRYHWGEGL